MKQLFSHFLIILSTIINAQDFDIYPKNQDDNIKMPYVHESLRLTEFQILSRNARMMDMAYAIIVPGYVHFKAKEKTTGYTLLTLRSLGYIGLGASYYSSKYNGNTLFGSVTNTNTEGSTIKISENWSIKKSDLIVGTSIAIIVSTYLFDWIHGKITLEKKQEYIRYKYSVKLKLQENKTSYIQKNCNPQLSLTCTF